MPVAYRILYVDDESGLLEIGKLFLEEFEDFRVTTSLSATEGIRLLEQDRFDAIISDYQMPEMDGIEFLAEVRRRFGSIPFILFTGRDREEVVIQAINSGADFYLQKGGEPVAQFAELSHKIRQAVQNRRADTSIRDHERRESDIINFLPDATFAIDTKGVVIAWNRAIEEMTGVPASEMLGKGNYEYAIPIYHERRPILIDLVLHDDPAIAASYPSMKRDGRVLVGEATRPDLFNGRGATIWFTAAPLYNNQGVIVGAIESIRDITGRTKQEQALRESEAHLSLAMEVGNAGIWEWNIGTDEVRFNAPFHAMLGYKPGTLPTSLKEWLTYHHPDDLAGILDKAGAFIRGGSSVYESEHRVRSENGEWNWLFTRGILTSTHETVSSRWFIGFAMNITGRKNAENALKESEEKYRSVIENIQDIYYRSDREGNLIMVSPSVFALLGYQSAEEVLGKSIIDTFYVDPGERKQFLAALERTGTVRDYETRLRKKDGTPIAVATSSHYYYDSKGQIAGVEGIFRDITLQKKLDEALKDSAQRLLEIISFLPDATFAIDKGGNVIAWNRAIEEMTGIPAAEILGKGDYAYAVPFYGTRRPILIDLVFSSREEVLEKYSFVDVRGDILTAETVNASPQGKPVILWGRAAPLYDRQGAITGAIESIRDITDRRQKEAALIQANEKLNLLSSITRHDINNQLAVLQGYLSILRKKKPDPSLNDFFGKAATAAQRISSMIQFTREYEQIGVKVPAWQDCRGLVDIAAEQAPLGQVRVINDLPAGTEVFADPLITRVFYNLMDNAARHGGKITAIRFTVEDHDGDRVIVCEDDGVGVPVEEKGQIFERGFGKNTGLGLFLVREILSLTGITITETGEPGRGARFEMGVPEGNFRFTPAPE